jgi:hypothetical protein
MGKSSYSMINGGADMLESMDGFMAEHCRIMMGLMVVLVVVIVYMAFFQVAAKEKATDAAIMANASPSSSVGIPSSYSTTATFGGVLNAGESGTDSDNSADINALDCSNLDRDDKSYQHSLNMARQKNNMSEYRGDEKFASQNTKTNKLLSAMNGN